MTEEKGADLKIGALFHGRYEIVRRLKTGGMGAVYEAVHVETKRRRALKVMLPSAFAKPEHHARFKVEATIAAEIRSQHIVETLDAGVDPHTGSPFLVMELLEGEDLAALADRRERLSPEEVVLFLRQAAIALDKIHDAGIVHRDVKPENLFLTRAEDGAPRLKLLDFGISKSLGGGAENTQMIGTPLYVAPEQVRGSESLGPASDNYALAHVAYRLLVGEHYWQRESEETPHAVALIFKVANGLPEPASSRARRAGVELPATFDVWFARAAASGPEARFPRASVQVEELARALEGGGVAAATFAPEASQAPASPPAEAAPAPSTPRRWRPRLVGGALVALLAVLGAAWAVIGYVQNTAYDDKTVAVVAAAARIPWHEPGHDAAKLEQLYFLRYRLIEVDYFGPRTHVYSAAFGDLGVASRPELVAAYAKGLTDTFAKPVRRLLEEKLRAPTARRDDTDLVRLYLALGAPVLAAEDRRWAAEHVHPFWFEELRRGDATLALVTDAELHKRTSMHTTHYFDFVHDGTIKPDPIDRALVDRVKATLHRP